ncbi:MAG: hypothetical protein AMXMBFR49_22930 [Chlorobiota bacterium]|nr:MAG: hypothetical protein EDM75_00155 [Chlorobiota bacterium]
MWRLFIFFILGGFQILGQSVPVPFPAPGDTLNHYTGEITALSETEYLAIHSVIRGTRAQVYLLRSTDAGTSWGTPFLLIDSTLNPSNAGEDSLSYPYIVRGNNNRLLAIYKVGKGIHYYRISDNNGLTWGPGRTLSLMSLVAAEEKTRITSAIHTGGDTIMLAVSRDQNYFGFSKSTDNGITFSPFEQNSAGTWTNGSLLKLDDGSLFLVCQEKALNNKKLLSMRYAPATGWSTTSVILTGTDDVNNPKLFRSSDGMLHVVYINTKASTGKHKNTDIYRISSTDGGLSWSAPTRLTLYAGRDVQPNINPQSVVPLMMFSSDRSELPGRMKLWFTNALNVSDTDAPPAIYSAVSSPVQPVPGDSVFIKVYAGYHGKGLTGSVKGLINTQPVDIPLYDDGAHKDSLAGDGVFGALIKVASTGDFAQIYASMQGGGKTVISRPLEWAIRFDDVYKSIAFDTGELWVPLDNRGVIGGVNVSGRSGITYDSIVVLYSAGPALSALKNGSVWGAANMTSSIIKDFTAGPVGASANDPRVGIYKLDVNDTAFGASWQRWKSAVELGARYWDGNSNGVYDPVDHNNNGVWDITEDRPEMLGEVSYWCVINDGVPATSRRLGEHPTGIEIRQTLYAYPYNESGYMRNAVFVRYEIVNTGTVVQSLPLAVFSFWGDPDIGTATDDLFGTDTLRNGVFCYNDIEDPVFGINPPAVYQSILFGKPVFIPGLTFVDNDQNGIYDPGADTPLDTAKIPFGAPFGTRTIPGASNLGLSTSQYYTPYDFDHGDPMTSVELRNYQHGVTKTAGPIDPCSWTAGNVTGEDCNKISRYFIFSGDPVLNTGWLDRTVADKRMMANSGRFDLNAGDTTVIHTVISSIKGENNLHSITLTRQAMDEIFRQTGARHKYIPTGLKGAPVALPDEYRLYQNFPNPFNPETEIRFSLRERSRITLTVYDILGCKVAELLGSELERGEYRHAFNGDGLSSGVYFIRLEARSSVSDGVEYSKTIKAVLLR